MRGGEGGFRTRGSTQAASHTDFRDGALLAVNLGDDADTTGAIYGQIAGAHYGIEAIPAQWRQRLAMRTEIESLADRLHDAAMTSGHQGSTLR